MYEALTVNEVLGAVESTGRPVQIQGINVPNFCIYGQTKLEDCMRELFQERFT